VVASISGNAQQALRGDLVLEADTSAINDPIGLRVKAGPAPLELVDAEAKARELFSRAQVCDAGRSDRDAGVGVLELRDQGLHHA